MAVPARATEKSATTGDSGELREMRLHKPCGYAHCEELGIASLGDEDLCCDHFVLRSYEFLQRIDAQRLGNGDVREFADLKDSVNSCLQGALEVSLRASSLNNLQKARLLDIMLWAGEFVHRSESHPSSVSSLLKNPPAMQGTKERLVYQKPSVKTRTTLLPQ